MNISANEGSVLNKKKQFGQTAFDESFLTTHDRSTNSPKYQKRLKDIYKEVDQS